MSTHSTSDNSENAPSKTSGQFHSAKGTTVEAVGNLTGAQSWQQSGKEEHAVSATMFLRTSENLIINYRLVKRSSTLPRPAVMQKAPPTVFRARRMRSSAPSREIASNRQPGTLTLKTNDCTALNMNIPM